jgi:hypothetical protein
MDDFAHISNKGRNIYGIIFQKRVKFSAIILVGALLFMSRFSEYYIV